MILTKKEINDLTPNLGDLWRIKSSHFKAIDRIKELEEEKLETEYQKDQAETMLQELVEAAEWRDECVVAVAHCLYRRESCWKMVSVSIDPNGYRKRWEKAVDHAKMLAEAAEAAYQAALKAAKEE